jgi:hypothetical protein
MWKWNPISQCIQHYEGSTLLGRTAVMAMVFYAGLIVIVGIFDIRQMKKKA